MDSTSPWTTLWGRFPTKAVNGGSSAKQKRNILKKEVLTDPDNVTKQEYLN
jgi:hypothetical protein